MDEKEFDYINMVPFIDVMLVLLTIILMTSTFIASGTIRVDLPRVAEKHENTPKAHVVEIDTTGNIYYQGRVVDLPSLRETIGKVSREETVLIKADKKVSLQSFVEVLDLVKTTGFKKVSLQTEWQGK
ncbi:MAG: biopolymer transporter ExbD [Syntrophus sp. (in: bacteria)]|nr:biopolymer transporter ExbD [Syntrophus sp. (in: bacteria)]